MKILVNLNSPGDVIRVDGLVIERGELNGQVTENTSVAFRGDDRPPTGIFVSGFTKRVQNWAAQCQKVFDTATKPKLEELLSEEFDSTRNPRTASCTLQNDDILFRPRHLDLVPETCVSLTLNLRLTPLFPLNQSSTSYIYVISAAGIPVLRTFEVQRAGGRVGLSIDSQEVTCNQVAGNHIMGAVKIARIVRGDGPSRTVQWKVLSYHPNPRSGRTLADFLAVAKTIMQGDQPSDGYYLARLGSAVSKEADATNTVGAAALATSLEVIGKYIKMNGSIRGLGQSLRPSAMRQTQAQKAPSWL